jgi:hypothetical protein
MHGSSAKAYSVQGPRTNGNGSGPAMFLAPNPFHTWTKPIGRPVPAPADRLDAFGTGLGQGFGGCLVASPKPYAHFSAALTIKGSKGEAHWQTLGIILDREVRHNNAACPKAVAIRR